MTALLRVGYSLVLSLLVNMPVFAEQTFPVGVVELRYETVQHTIQAYARVEERPQFLHFEIDGFMKILSTDVDQAVLAGQVLAELDTTEIDNQIQITEAAREYARKKLEKAQLLRQENAMSQDQLEDWEHQHRTKELELVLLKARYEKHFLRAPVMGLIANRFFDFSSAVSIATPIFTLVASDRPWRITADLTQREVVQLEKGNNVRLVFQDDSMPVLLGSVVKAHSAKTGNLFSVEIDLIPSQDTKMLKVAMQGKVYIETAKQYQGYNIPIAGLLGVSGDQSRIYVVENGRAKALSVTLLRIDDDSVMVREDLSGYTGIIVRGQHYLVDGALVDINSQ